MLKVPEGVSWQQLRDNIPDPELGHKIMQVKVAKDRNNFTREIQWLKEEMRQRLRLNYIKPLDRLDPTETASTLFLFDDVAKKYWSRYTKDKLRSDNRFSRFFATPEGGFNNPSTTAAMGLFFPNSARGDTTMTQYTRGVPMVSTPLARGRRHSRVYSPLLKISHHNSDAQLRLKGPRVTSNINYAPKFKQPPFHAAKAA
eukprot:TRINITY_DN9133_c0_g1_i2.p2 TRINITY_DN9133_c0_g1~~TRINITY_DN9133_c0_g1_i2.p2  ORF type:complete len:200 (+),score=37.50 TRINITY_DN9133_c0_g1_i2:759-1358(+)